MAGREGTTLGQYRLIRLLGTGAAGEVYLAEGPAPTHSSAQVAIKVLGGSASDATTREIARQAQAAAALQQSHMLPVHAVIEHEGTLAVVMAFAPGGSLGDTLAALASSGTPKLELPLPGGVVARLVGQLARALSAAHAAGLVHGDLKPSNVFVRTSPNGSPIAAVADFGQSVITGAAAALAARGPGAGGAAWVASQLVFAAPEQLRGSTTPASDQYSLASLAYLLLTGQPPFSGAAGTLLAAIPAQLPVPPLRLNPALTPAVESALLRGLAKAPEQRFSSIAAFAQALDDALAETVGASAGATGITQQFSQLEGSHAGLRRPAVAGSSSAGRSGLHVYDRSGASSGSHRSPVLPAELAGTAPRVNRRLAIVSAVAVAIALLACVLGFQAFEGSSVLPRIRLGAGAFGGTAPTATVDAAAVAKAHAAEAQLRTATAGTPTFSDPLTSNANHWPADGKTTFFARDGLHIHDQSTTTLATADAPAGAGTPASFALQVDVTMDSGSVSDEAGLRFFVQPGSDGQDYYGYLISAEGRYEIILHHDGRFLYLRSGYASGLKSGFQHTNRLAVLVQSSQQTADFYANGQFVAEVGLAADGPGSGPDGLMVLNDGAEASFAHYALYSLGS